MAYRERKTRRIGDRVVVRYTSDTGETTDRVGCVVFFGRDVYGIYTAVRMDDGETERFHRDRIRAVEGE